MKVFYNPDQQLHDPTSFIRSGQVAPSPECPERAVQLLAGIESSGHDIVGASAADMGPIAAIHAPDYLNFLETAHARWQALPNPGPEVIANVHPGRHMGTRAPHVVGQAGFFMADTACPIGAGTWRAVQAAAGCALDAARYALQHNTYAYALCRPPGHHAYADQAGGFCFLNNAAIAAQMALDQGRRVSILDVDVHHGNGTQGIFYRRKDVMNVSVHADPANYYPFFAGYADERGEGEGAGYNLNLPQPHGSGDDVWLAAIADGLKAVQQFGTDLLIVSLGLDPQENDPLGALKITTDGFRRAGDLIARAGHHSLIIQEGGYLCDELGANLVAFLDGFQNAAR